MQNISKRSTSSFVLLCFSENRLNWNHKQVGRVDLLILFSQHQLLPCFFYVTYKIFFQQYNLELTFFLNVVELTQSDVTMKCIVYRTSPTSAASAVNPSQRLAIFVLTCTSIPVRGPSSVTSAREASPSTPTSRITCSFTPVSNPEKYLRVEVQKKIVPVKLDRFTSEILNAIFCSYIQHVNTFIGKYCCMYFIKASRIQSSSSRSPFYCFQVILQANEFFAELVICYGAQKKGNESRVQCLCIKAGGRRLCKNGHYGIGYSYTDAIIGFTNDFNGA